MQIVGFKNIKTVGVGSCMVCRHNEAIFLVKMIDGDPELGLRLNLCVCGRCFEIASKEPDLVASRFVDKNGRI